MVKTESELYFKILEFLSKDAFTKKQHVEKLLLDYFSQHNFYDMDDLQGRIDVMILFIYNMAKSGHVKYNTSISSGLSKSNLVSDSKPKLEDFSVLASITPNGFLFLNKEHDRKSSKRNNRLQIRLTIVTTIFIGLTAGYAGLTYELQSHEILKPKDKNRLSQSQKTIPLKGDTVKYHQKEVKKGP